MRIGIIVAVYETHLKSSISEVCSKIRIPVSSAVIHIYSSDCRFRLSFTLYVRYGDFYRQKCNSRFTLRKTQSLLEANRDYFRAYFKAIPSTVAFYLHLRDLCTYPLPKAFME